MDLIGLTALAGLAFALLVHAALLILASLAGPQRSLVYPALAIVTASLLAWQGLVDAPWLPATVGLLLLAAAAAVLIVRKPRLRLPSFSLVEWLALVLLSATALYGAFPDYRQDQWNNDLVLAKVVADGPLRAPIFEEHVYYGGNYQYLFTLPRRLSSDDMFNHGAADAFSWLLFVFGLAGLLARLRSAAFPALPPVCLLLAWAAFGIPDSTALFNAKPDPLMLVIALAILELSAGPLPEDSRGLHGFLLGFLLVAPSALKLTWAVFLVAAFFAWLFLFAIRRPPPLPRLGPFAAGGLSGLVTMVPYALTNWKFFGNPLHPAQLGSLLRSSYWDKNFSDYYADVAGRAASGSEYVATLVQLVTHVSWHLYPLLTPVLLVLVVALVRRRGLGPIGPRGAAVLLHAVLASAFFLLAWPGFFRANIYPRYVYSGLALAFAALLGVLHRTLSAEGSGPAWLRRLAVLAMLLPVALEGSLPRQLAFVARFGLANRERFLAEGPPEWQMARDLLRVNDHRRRVAPGARYFARTTLLDMSSTYQLDGAAFRMWSREFQRLESKHGQEDGAVCPWRTLARLDVAYVCTRFRFDPWPDAYRRVVDELPAIDGSSRIRYVDPQLLAARAAAETGCDGAATP